MSTKKLSLLEVLIWFIVFLLLLLVSSPLAMGFKIKSDYSNLVKMMAAIAQVDMRVVRYDRGFFSSDAVLEMRIPNAPVVLQFKETIIHGPVYLGMLNQGKSPLVAAVIKGELVAGADFSAEVNKMFKGQSPLVYQNIVSYSGDVESDGYVPPVDALIEEDAGTSRIQSSGMVLKSRIVGGEQKISGDSLMPSLIIDTDDSSVRCENLNINFSANMGRNGLLMGDSNLALRKLDIESPQKQFAIHDFRFRTMTSEVGQLVNSNTQINAREIYASNERFGPATLNLSVNGLNAVSLREIQNMQREAEKKISEGVPQEQVNAMIAGQMISLVPDLIKQADIRIEPLKLESELGTLETTLMFSVEGLDQNVPADPLFMLSALNLDVNFDVDEALMKQIVHWYLVANADKIKTTGDKRARRVEAKVPMEQKVRENLRGLVDENWLTFNEGIYSSHITMSQGQMQLNDRLVDPLKQFMPQMASPGGAVPGP